MVGCRFAADEHGARPHNATVTIGFGLAKTDDARIGMQSAASVIAYESLARLERDGRPVPAVAEGWSVSPDGLSLTIRLRPDMRLHDGTTLSLQNTVDFLRRQLPRYLGAVAADISSIDPQGDREVVIHLHRPSAFIPEGLDVPMEDPARPNVGSGAFRVASSSADGIELVANEDYYLGAPQLSRVVFKPYPSSRAACVDLMRGQIDVLYDIGPDALDLVRPATNVRVYEFRERYAYSLVLNVRSPPLNDRRLRVALNEAIDRERLVADAFRGFGSPAVGPVWPEHWAFNREFGFQYDVRTAAARVGAPATGRPRIQFSCLVADATQERLALVVQQQLQAIGVDLKPELVSGDELLRRLSTGRFDAVLLNVLSGPNVFRLYQWWRSGAPYNFGGFQSAAVDESLSVIRHAIDEASYRKGVSNLQQAIADDPPAVFLSWSHRARVVRSSLEVAPNPGGDVLKTLHRWRPAAVDDRIAGRN
jgi:ABC-type transport system substrate-binding protein